MTPPTITHLCPTKHRTPRTIAACQWPAAAWVVGQGEYALLAHCDVLTVSLWATMDAAESRKSFIDRTACGHACTRHHEIVRLVQ